MIRLVYYSTLSNKLKSSHSNYCKNRLRNITKTAHQQFLFSSAPKQNNVKYILSQFPYPSGQLHLGHARVYYIGDTLARFYKLRNQQVIYPIGFDSFGLPAQNAAILHNKNPKLWTQNNISQMKQQLNCLEIDFDWNRELATHMPQYYKWTQYIFIQMLKKGLAYKAESQVNWDPIDKTVLANQQVDNLGRSWRSGALVEKKMLSQWFFKISAYASQLQDNLKQLQWIEKVKSMQAGWIGYQKGYQGTFDVEWLINQENLPAYLGQHKLKFEHIMQSIRSKKQYNKTKIQVFVKNPKEIQNQCFVRYNIQATKKQNEHVDLSSLERDVIVGNIFIHNTHQNKAHKIPVILGYQQNGITFQLLNANPKQQNQSKQKLQNDSPKIQPALLQQSTKMRIKDWSISRQRYWGTPIPIIYCSNCGIVPVPESQLPVKLPQWKSQSQPNPLLSQQFRRCQCPKCKNNQAQRQTDTMDTFVDSSWYYLRFLDSQNDKQICNKKLADHWMPVDIYIGGIQHAIMHLLYARFIMRTLSTNLNICQVNQPFKQLVVQGLVKGKTVRHKVTGKYLKPDEILNYKQNEIQQTFEKMSKSKFNGLNPTNLVDKYGPDALRIALFFAAPPEHDVDFHEDLLVSADRFLKRVQQTFRILYKNTKIEDNYYQFITAEKLKAKINESSELDKSISSEKQMKVREVHQKIRKIIQKLEHAIEKRYMHVYVANTMQLFNEIKSITSQSQNRFILEYVFIPVLFVIAPRTVSKIFPKRSQQQGKYVWPDHKYFPNLREYLIMKGKKLIKKGVIVLQHEYEDVEQKQSHPKTKHQGMQQVGINNRKSQINQKLSEMEKQIRSKLNLSADAIIKNNKTNIVILIK